MPRLADLRRTLDAHGQSHLLRFHEELSERERRQLLVQVAGLDLDEIDALIRILGRGPAAPAAPPADLAPAPCYGLDPADPARPYDAERLRREGDALVRRGRVAAFTVAGGQGTRLGWSGPKGTYPATTVTGKPLFRCLAEQILAVQKKYQVTIPWYIMTSPMNDADTQAFFADNNCFGLIPKNVVMLPQGVMPAVEAATGRILLESRGALALSPDGHGGALRALRESGALEDMRSRGIEHISSTQIDNPLVRIVDPLFLGLHATAPDSSGEMSSKMVAKTDPAEKVGVFCTAGGRLQVIEYSDLPPELAAARDPEGRLRFRAGSIAVHVLSVGFVERLTAPGAAVRLPWHRALKLTPHVDLETGRRVEPAEPNAVRFELFVFDAIPLAESSIVLETDRTEEFAPIKNARGADSPATSHRLQSERAGRWLEAHGVRVPRDGDGRVAARLEISPLTALEPADLVAVDLPGEIEEGQELAL